MGSDKDQGQAGTTAKISATQNIRPGIIIVFNPSGSLVYDGPGNLMPPELLTPGSFALMHLHDKMAMDAISKRKVNIFAKK